MDRINNNTYRTWEQEGKPSSSSGVDISTIEKSGVLKSTNDYLIETNDEGSAKLKLSLIRHSMKLIELNYE